jgi:hypothetical protein
LTGSCALCVYLFVLTYLYLTGCVLTESVLRVKDVLV